MLASFPLAYRSSYVASKAALKGFATATRYEMAPHGVWLTTVEPGSVKTGISDPAHEVHRRRLPPRRELPHDAARSSTATSGKASPPSGWPGRSSSAIEAKEPDALYAVGSNASAVFALRRALPQSIVEGDRVAQVRHAPPEAAD